jgi:hypothetical protein
VYGLNADFRPWVGEGMSCVAVAMLHLLPSEQRASRTAINPGREEKGSRWQREEKGALIKTEMPPQ